MPDRAHGDPMTANAADRREKLAVQGKTWSANSFESEGFDRIES